MIIEKDISRGDEDCCRYSIYIGHEFVGEISVIKEKTRKKENIYNLFSFQIEPKFRKQGYGTKLLNHIINIAKDDNIKLIALGCSKKTIGFYNKFGFKVIDNENHEISNISSYICMQLIL